MSFLNVTPEAVTSAAGNLESIGSALNVAHAAAAAPTTGAAAMAADEVSAAVQSAFATYAQRYQAVSAQAAAFHSRLVASMNSGAVAYAEAEMANARQAVSAELAAAAQPARADVAAVRQAAKTDALAARRVMRADAKVAKDEVAGMVNPLSEKYLGRPLIRTADTAGTTSSGSTQGSGGNATTTGGSTPTTGGNTTTTGGSDASGANGGAPAKTTMSGDPAATPVAKQAVTAAATGSAPSDAASAAQGLAPASATATAASAAATAAPAATAATGTTGDVTGSGVSIAGNGTVATGSGSSPGGNATATTGGGTGSSGNGTVVTGSGTGSGGNATVATGSVSTSPPVTEADVKTPLGSVQVTLDQSVAADGTTSWSGSITMPPAVADAVDAAGAQLSATAALHTDVAAFTAAMQTGHPVAAVHALLRAPGDVAHAYLYGQSAVTESLPAPTGYTEAYATVPTGGLLSPLEPVTVTLVPSTGSPTVVTLTGTELGGVATGLTR